VILLNPKIMSILSKLNKLDMMCDNVIITNLNQEDFMETITSSNVKNRVGTFMDAARKSPVLITKNGRPSIVALPAEDYERMELEALRNKLSHSEEQAERGEYVESSLEVMLKRLKKKREQGDK